MISNSVQTTDKVFVEKLKQGVVCLHPTDTLPGLAVDPTNLEALGRLGELKGRNLNKPFIGLIGSVEQALTFWHPLPSVWVQFLRAVWPGSVSVVWRARSNTPRALCSEKGELALRWPKLDHENRWLSDLLIELSWPLPSTSVNRSGEPPVRCWNDAIAWLQQNSSLTYCSPKSASTVYSAQPSTVVRIDRDGSYEILRVGAQIEKVRSAIEALDG